MAAWVALTINFFLPQLIPGNPVEALIGRMSQSGTVPPGEAKILTSLLGLGTGNIFQQVLAVPGRAGRTCASACRSASSPPR